MISPLRQKRLLAEKTIYDIALATDIDPGRLSLIERNYKNPRKEEMHTLAKTLNCKVADIFPEAALAKHS